MNSIIMLVCIIGVLVALVFAKLDFDYAAMIQMFRIAPIMKWHLYSAIFSTIKLNIIRILFCVIASKNPTRIREIDSNAK